ncbi:hypothetical protein ACHAQA_008494 [Verticillium albo-atrum]
MVSAPPSVTLEISGEQPWYASGFLQNRPVDFRILYEPRAPSPLIRFLFRQQTDSYRFCLTEAARGTMIVLTIDGIPVKVCRPAQINNPQTAQLTWNDTSPLPDDPPHRVTTHLVPFGPVRPPLDAARVDGFSGGTLVANPERAIAGDPVAALAEGGQTHEDTNLDHPKQELNSIESTMPPQPRIKKKKGPFNEVQRRETAEVRGTGAYIVLYRPAGTLSSKYTTRWKTKKLCDVGDWVSDPVYIDMMQSVCPEGKPIRLLVRKFKPMSEDRINREWHTTTGAKMHDLAPYALANVKATIASFDQYISDHAEDAWQRYAERHKQPLRYDLPMFIEQLHRGAIVLLYKWYYYKGLSKKTGDDKGLAWEEIVNAGNVTDDQRSLLLDMEKRVAQMQGNVIWAR